MEIGNLLNWLTGADSGAFIVVSWALSWALEDWDKWQALASKLKSLIILIVSIALGAGAVWLQMHPATMAAIEPYTQPVTFVILTWLATQIPHKLNPSRNKITITAYEDLTSE